MRKRLDRLTLAEYSINDSNEAFTIDDLGNRDSVIVRDGNNVDYDIDNLSNRYDSVGGNTLAYDAAGNLTKDRQGYTYQYDYENRITKIMKSGPITVAEYSYDALGRRIEKKDSITSANTRRYYYNDNWQILCEYDGGGNFKQWYAYGNYIDEVLIRGVTTGTSSLMYYGHDHLYSPVLLAYYTGTPFERYEYDAYGNCQIMDASYNPRSSSLYGNLYYFTGRETDSLDSGSLKIMNYRHRYYDTYTGRFLMHDRLGYMDGMNLYEYVSSNPVRFTDPTGNKKNFCKCFCPTALYIEPPVEFIPTPPGELLPGESIPHAPTPRAYVKFTVVLRGSWIWWDKKGDGRPDLMWMEKWTQKPDIPYYDGLATNTWYDMYRKSKGESAVFKEYREMKPLPDCSLTKVDAVRLRDEPGIHRGLRTIRYDQRVFFFIYVAPQADCPCSSVRLNDRPIWIKATYRGEGVRGTLSQHWFAGDWILND